MIIREDLVHYCNQLLKIDSFQDYCPNGLQIQGRLKIRKIITGVTASQALIDAAIRQQADAIIVHHGFFWKGEAATITGMKYRRIRQLIKHRINLLAYHLPLDAHPELGNNAVFARQLGLQGCDFFGRQNLAILGHIPATGIKKLKKKMNQLLQRKPLLIQSAMLGKKVSRIAICTGAAQSMITDALAAQADVFISGEISENTVHFARENPIHYLACGHHASERFGVQALAEHLQQKLQLDCEFIDCDNPV